MSGIAQHIADKFLAAYKIKATETNFHLTSTIKKPISIPLIAPTIAGETFSLDVSQKRIVLKLKCQLRCTTGAVVLARLDFASPHRNPDGTEVGVPHLHVYREGYGDRFAYEVPAGMTIPFRYFSPFLQPTTSKGTASLICLTQPTSPCLYDRLRYHLPGLAEIPISLPRNWLLHGNHHTVSRSPQRPNPTICPTDHRRLVTH